MARNAAVTIHLTPREKAAVLTYTQALGVSVSEWLRAQALPEVPAQFWERLAPPPGQLTIPTDDE